MDYDKFLQMILDIATIILEDYNKFFSKFWKKLYLRDKLK